MYWHPLAGLIATSSDCVFIRFINCFVSVSSCVFVVVMDSNFRDYYGIKCTRLRHVELMQVNLDYTRASRVGNNKITRGVN